jgi:hypothetical protein
MHRHGKIQVRILNKIKKRKEQEKENNMQSCSVVAKVHIEREPGNGVYNSC